MNGNLPLLHLPGLRPVSTRQRVLGLIDFAGIDFAGIECALSRLAADAVGVNRTSTSSWRDEVLRVAGGPTQPAG